MCWICNPFCGNCHPPTKRTVVCPECGASLVFGKSDFFDGAEHHCGECLADITQVVRIEPVECKRSGLVCAYPCGQATRGSSDGLKGCLRNTPVPV